MAGLCFLPFGLLEPDLFLDPELERPRLLFLLLPPLLPGEREVERFLAGLLDFGLLLLLRWADLLRERLLEPAAEPADFELKKGGSNFPLFRF